MADGSFPTLVSKDRSSNALANPLYVQLSDGSVALTTVPVSIASTLNVDIQDSWAGLTGSGTEAGVLRVTIATDSTGVITVDASDLDIRNLNLTDDAVKVSGNGTANSSSNPIYVAITGAGVSTTEVQNYDTEASVGADLTDNHDYAVTGTTFMLRSVIVSASGGMKAEVQVGPVATLVSKAVIFIPRGGGTTQINFDPAIEVPVTSTGTVRIIRTNRQGASMDVYSTIIGNDLP